MAKGYCGAHLVATGTFLIFLYFRSGQLGVFGCFAAGSLVNGCPAEKRNCCSNRIPSSHLFTYDVVNCLFHNEQLTATPFKIGVKTSWENVYLYKHRHKEGCPISVAQNSIPFVYISITYEFSNFRLNTKVRNGENLTGFYRLQNNLTR